MSLGTLKIAVIMMLLVTIFAEPVSGKPTLPTFTFVKIVDTTTSVPGDIGNFQEFGIPQINKGAVSFSGSPNLFEFTGVYTTLGGTLRVVADTNTPVPDGFSTFGGFDQTVDMTRNSILFRGDDGAGPGIYGEFDGVLRVVADTTTPVPGGVGTFDFFTNPPAISGSAVAFQGTSRSDPVQNGIYLARISQMS